MKFPLAIALLALLLDLARSHEKLHYKCHHEEITKGFKIGSSDVYAHEKRDPTTRRLLTSTIRQIRIKTDFSDAETFISLPANTAVNSLYQMSRRVMENVRLYFMKFLQVNTPDTMSMTSKTCTGGVVIPTINAESIDLNVFIKAQNDNATTYFAAASTCQVDATTGRPIAGVYFLNFYRMSGTPMYEYFYFTTYAHEFMHILYFSQQLFDTYRVSITDPTFLNTVEPTIDNITSNGKTVKGLKYKKLMDYARQYYKCTDPAFNGMPLEDGGGSGTAGSHWEKLYLPEDIMNPTIENPARISPFTIKVIESTGWYLVVGDMSSHYDWAKDSGCVTLKTTCPTGYEYCPANSSVEKNICSPDYMTKATCSNLTDYFGACLVKRKLEVSCILDLPREIQMGEQEVYGSHSRCISWEKKDSPMEASAECHAIRCVNGELHLRLKNNFTKICRYEGEKIPFPGAWQIVCPDPKRYCSTFSSRCPMDCSGTNGFCLNGGKCFCFFGYSGSDCGICAQCKPTTDPFILSSNLSGSWVQVDAFDLANNESGVRHYCFLLFMMTAILSLF